MSNGAIKLAPLMAEIKVDIASFKSDMSKIKAEAISRANEVSKQMERTIKVGNQMSNVGGKLTKSLTLPLAGAGVAAAKMAVDYESSFAKVSTLLDKNVVDYDKYKNDILDASSKSKVAVGEFSEAVYGSISAGVDQTKAIKFTTDAMKLAKGGFTDGAKAVDVMTTAINGYGMKAEDATKISDMLITTQNLGKTTVDELASSMGAVIPVASSVNYGMDELSASYAQLTKNGIATAESGTYLKSMLSELGKSGSITDKALRELTGKGFADLKKEGKSTSSILRLLNKDAEKNGKTLKDMFGSVEAGSAALVLAKRNGKEYDEMLSAMKKSAGATQEAFDKMDAAPAEQLKGALNELKNEAIKLGAKAIPIITEGARVISKLVEGFGSLSPEMQSGIVKFGLFAAAAGPVLKIGGSLVSTYGKLKPILSGTGSLLKKGVPLLGKLGASLASHAGIIGKVGSSLSKIAPAAGTATTALSSVASGAAGTGTAVTAAASGVGGLLSSLGGIAVAAAPWVAGAAAIGAAGYGIYKTLNKDVIPEVDIFKSKTTAALDEATGKWTMSTVKISEETKKQVQSYMDLSDKAQQETLNMFTGVTKITDSNTGKIAKKVDMMAESIITSSKKQRDATVKEYESALESVGISVDGQAAKVIKATKEECDERVKKVKKTKEKLVKLYKEIAKNGNEVTGDQKKKIDQLYDEMKGHAIEAMSQNKAEQETILYNLNNSSERITADMASKAIKQMNKIRDKSVKAAQEEHDEVIATAMKMKDSKVEGAEETAKAMMDAADKELEAAKKSAEDIRNEGINKLMSANEELADKIDITSGNIVNYWDKMFGKWDRWDPRDKICTVTTEYVDRHRTSYSPSYSGKGGNSAMFAANGYDYIPFNGYNARLHKGERVLTKAENEEYTKEQSKYSTKDGITLNVNSPKHLSPSETAERIKIAMQEMALMV